MNIFSRNLLGNLIVPAALIAIGGLWMPSAHAAEPIVGTVTHLSGVVAATRADGSVKLLSVKSELAQGDVLSTEDDSYVRIKFVDSAELVLRPNTVLKVTSYIYNEADPKTDSIALDLQKGGFRAVSGVIGTRNREAVSYNTPSSVIHTQGTHFGALFCNNDCGGVPTPTGKTPDNGLHVDVAANAISVTPNPIKSLPGLPAGGTGSAPALPPGGLSPGLFVVAPPTLVSLGSKPPTTVFNAGQFGYLPLAGNGMPQMVLVPPSQAVQVRMPSFISQNSPSAGVTGKQSDPECVVQ